jgi:ABC-type spermidine/putrescine transport system permease subunit II
MSGPHRGGRLAASVLVALVVVLYGPLVFLVVASVNENPASTGWWGFTTRWYSDALDDQSLRDAVGVSVRLAIWASVLATAIGTVAAIAVRRTPTMQRIATLLATLRVGIPEIIIATGLGAMIPALGLGFGLRPMIVAHIAYLSAFVVLLVGARAAGADVSHEEAAQDLGANRWQVLRHVVLPDLRPAIVAAAVLTAAFSFDDVALSLTLRGPQDTTVPVYILSAVQRRVTPSVHAIGAMVLMVGVVAFVVAWVVNRSVVAHDARRSPGAQQR